MASRIRPLLQNLISPNQSVFIPRRWIEENSLLVNKIVHSSKSKKGTTGYIGIKFDLHKAYDRVNWGVLHEILIHFGFSARVVTLINQCFSINTISILLNDSICGTVKWERGLRQGDPISPYLFILFEELLSRMLHKLEREGKLHGVNLGRSSIPISHPLYADDLLIFCRAKCSEMLEVANCMKQFYHWTSYQVNNIKSGCFFSRNVPGHLRAKIKGILNIKELPKEAKYLGNPLFVSQNKTKDFEELWQKVEARLQSWRANLLSQSRRLVLVKSVITSIPIYTMSSCKLPKKWCKDLDQLANSFLWKGNSTSRPSYSLVSWSKVCRPKKLGRLGVRKLKEVNMALLCKIGLYLETHINLPWVRAVKVKHFPSTTLMKAVGKQSDSWYWKGFLSIRSVLTKGIWLKVGKGNNINF